MHFLQPELHTRRAFLQRSAQLAATGVALPTALNLAAIGEAAAMQNPTDYKALVCIFLYGGNDYANTVVPYDDVNYDKYSAIRGGGAGRTAGGIALAQAALTPTLLSPLSGFSLPNNQQYALHPSMTKLADLFNTGKVAVQLNVGPLVVPLTRAQYSSNNRILYPLPPKLFSHNDQQSVWQSSSPEGSTVGWGGRIGDLALNFNQTSLFTCISVTGNTVFLSGNQALSYQIGTSGTVKINSINTSVYGSSAVKSAMSQLIQQTGTHILDSEYNTVMRRSIASEAQMSAALAANPATGSIYTGFPTNNNLADQLKTVARIIAARNTLGNKRQVFFVSIGGFDLHDFLIAKHPELLKKVSDAMAAFHKATVDLGVEQQVTTFTASDFGRTLSSNGDGSDHGWGSHHFVMGGAVKGQRFYGSPPPVSVTNTAAPEDQFHVGQGRLLPTTSVNQYAATLAKWFGVEGNGTTGSELARVFPQIVNFGSTEYPVDLGFMA